MAKKKKEVKSSHPEKRKNNGGDMLIKLKNVKSWRKSLTWKLSLFIILLLLISILVIDFISVYTAVQSVLEESKKSYYAATDATKEYIKLAFQTAKDEGFQIMADELVQRYFSEAKQALLDEYEAFKLRSDANKTIQNRIISNSMFSGIFILTKPENSLLFPSLPVELDFKRLRETSWYKKVINSESAVILENHYEGFDEVVKDKTTGLKEYALSIAFPFKDIETNTTLGVMLVDISVEWLQEVLKNTQINNQGGFMLTISQSGRIILPSDWELRMKSVPKKDSEFVLKIMKYLEQKQYAGVFSTQFEGRSYLITYSNIEGCGWTLVGMIPLAQLTKSAWKMALLIIGLTILFTVFALYMGVKYAMKIVKDIKSVHSVFSIAKNGDLNVSITLDRDDEIGELAESFNSMVGNIRNLVQKSVELSNQLNASIGVLNTVASETATASNEVAKAIGEIAEGASNQAKEASSVYNTVSKFGGKIEAIVEESSKMENLSKSVETLSEKGKEAVESLTSTSSHTYDISLNLITTVKRLADYSNKINKVLQVLSSLSEQTKLLALNASIEAVKAGDAGRGFAVVASEIRKLADQSKDFMREIENVVKTILRETALAQQISGKVEDVMKLQKQAVTNVDVSFSNIQKAVAGLLEGIERIANNIIEIDKEKDYIIKSMESISAISEETAASSEEVSAATEQQLAAIEELRAMTEQLNKLSKDLNDAMSVFKV
ncbi:methyl-accepting chemotaxis sensory transducer [Caldicellulosiruptor acetigenus I77R1B]|uniref:Methyl-accepting chemotaxis sensory transducer n=1 Tax=Caldicellulosiruptor acetigenus (strain ATCC 700853 / DSM 12137 / I77R1B) TaxID=632335 RepID=E4S7X5_CALA7|nr:methyl-accepting chemotaxis protein [Caldicellulosiruptor acetigenus]ADQ41875.1 methyl-accepting chemotaxis sensory transducer [Caldicellulosiruptor acetigenus I77R1B]